MESKTIVVSAVNLNVGGTLTILQDCLGYLSQLASIGEYRVVALVFDKNLAWFPHIEYIETRWPKKNWVNRLWYEYVSMKKISKGLAPVHLWLSLHDTTPNVVAERRAVYCHNPFPFYKWKMREWLFTPKIVLFALFSKYIYRANIYNNSHVVVQQQWIKDEFMRLFVLTPPSIIVAPPSVSGAMRRQAAQRETDKNYSFIYASSPNSHKNFECVCRAAELLSAELGTSMPDIYITIKGNENKYAEWLYKNWGKHIPGLHFVGFLDKQSLYKYYEECDCLIFPSKVETWGLPISEFAVYDKPMLLADLPYAHETASGAREAAFFDPENSRELADMICKLSAGDRSFLGSIDKLEISHPMATSWDGLFKLLLD